MPSWRRNPRAAIPSVSLSQAALRSRTTPCGQTHRRRIRLAYAPSARSQMLWCVTPARRSPPAPEPKPRCSKFLDLAKYLGEGTSRKEAEEKSSAFFIFWTFSNDCLFPDSEILYPGLDGMRRWVGLGVIADNVIQMGCYLARQS